MNSKPLGVRPARKMADTLAQSRFRRTERGEHQHFVFGIREKPKYSLCNDPQCSFAADHQLSEVIARRIFQGIGSGPNDRSIGQDHFEIQDICVGHSVLDRLGTTGIQSEITSNEKELPQLDGSGG